MNLYIMSKIFTRPTEEQEIAFERKLFIFLMLCIIGATGSLCMAGIYLWDYWGRI